MGPNAMAQNALSRATGIPQTTLSGWLRDVVTSPTMKKESKDEEETPPARRPEDWTPEEKLQLVVETNGLEREALSELLRRRGVHRPQLEEWREVAREALRSSNKGASVAAARRIRELEREVRRKDKALAETAALLVLRKKAEALWGDEDDDTAEKSETRSSPWLTKPWQRVPAWRAHVNSWASMSGRPSVGRRVPADATDVGVRSRDPQMH
jgi:transposase